MCVFSGMCESLFFRSLRGWGSARRAGPLLFKGNCISRMTVEWLFGMMGLQGDSPPYTQTHTQMKTYLHAQTHAGNRTWQEGVWFKQHVNCIKIAPTNSHLVLYDNHWLAANPNMSYLCKSGWQQLHRTCVCVCLLTSKVHSFFPLFHMSDICITGVRRSYMIWSHFSRKHLSNSFLTLPTSVFDTNQLTYRGYGRCGDILWRKGIYQVCQAQLGLKHSATSVNCSCFYLPGCHRVFDQMPSRMDLKLRVSAGAASEAKSRP